LLLFHGVFLAPKIQSKLVSVRIPRGRGFYVELIFKNFKTKAETAFIGRDHSPILTATAKNNTLIQGLPDAK
jgi:hypothetical protein